MTDIIAVWEQDFKPIQSDIETNIPFIRMGKAVKQPMEQQERAHNTLTGLNLRNGLSERKASYQTAPVYRPSVSPARSQHSQPPSPNYHTKPLAIENGAYSPGEDGRMRIMSVPSQGPLAQSMPNYQAQTSPDYLSPASAHAPAGPKADYFSRDRVPSNGSAMTAMLATKKKPPPPPPKKKPSYQGFWVTALYDFAGQGEGDLVFKEGDRIKVTKKTESTEDWWEGELYGVHGSFPANYCQSA
jgi:amphiphysin